ncbi:MAG: gamma-glutamylcyclotransferase [Deferrisomatales bacterium]|nr:gamma-glutamylcyclotransferase [Deferrisomatales bacterium]
MDIDRTPGDASTLDRVFVYGTLQVGGRYHHLAAPFVRGWTKGSAPGVLLNLGEYPGWVEGVGTVRGQVLRLQPIERALGIFDQLEDYLGPGHPDNLYQRLSVVVTTPHGPVRAWGYRYVGPRSGHAVLPGGRWPP